jgi:plasmid maintenance system antidote protein VapI
MSFSIDDLVNFVAISAEYLNETRQVVIKLDNEAEFKFSVDKCQGLQNVDDRHLSNIEIFPSGIGLRWESLDVDLSIPHLMMGIFGTKQWMFGVPVTVSEIIQDYINDYRYKYRISRFELYSIVGIDSKLFERLMKGSELWTEELLWKVCSVIGGSPSVLMRIQADNLHK